ncbi:GFA family protein [Thalassovita aquimarina]|uniref:GFA family protein n=1 Tax=Thalassovita aquimarina TaxID=2785917 RepID=A0ABS5HVF1_9RHOB|nr:GFA family protein [Thalassovita aquimarina]MBR9652965.1 GFA family protein [Thalassovita aquimarina]
MTETTKGSCLCGGVAFEIHGKFGPFLLCHCARCRKDTGSAHAANLFVPGGRIKWTRGKALVRSFRLAGTRHSKSFCTVCGSAVPDVQEEGALLAVPAGSLDTPLDKRPEAHISWQGRADWDEGLDRLPRLAGLPE